MEDLERTQNRLDRIESILPVLAALRTISLASWRQALRQHEQVQGYLTRLRHASYQLPAGGPARASLQRQASKALSASARPIRRSVLVLGSERGLCGRFNLAVIERAEILLAEELPPGSLVELEVLGSRIGRMLGRRGHRPQRTGKLSLTSLPSFGLASNLARRGLAAYQDDTLDELLVVYSDYSGMGECQPRVARLVPPVDPARDGAPAGEPDTRAIIETDARSLREHLMNMLVAAQIYEALIRSAAAEHSTRFQLMDGASRNAERIIEELTLAVQSARQQAITREMQELAAGAGLIGQRIS